MLDITGVVEQLTGLIAVIIDFIQSILSLSNFRDFYGL